MIGCVMAAIQQQNVRRAPYRMPAGREQVPSLELGTAEHVCCACVQRGQPKLHMSCSGSACRHGVEADPYEVNWRRGCDTISNNDENLAKFGEMTVFGW